MDGPPTYSISETAALLGVSNTTIERAISRGELPAIRLGRRVVRIPRVEIDRLLAEGNTRAAS